MSREGAVIVEEKILIILQDIQSKMSSMDSKISSMDSEIKGIKTQLEEHGQILKALEHSAAVSNAKQDVIENDVAHIRGDVESIKSDLCFVEQATAKNWNDIAHLKAIK